jgi:hypothetical protein
VESFSGLAIVVEPYLWNILQGSKEWMQE